MQHHTAIINGFRMHYVRAGAATGDPVVLLHGWPQTAHSWRHVIARLSDRYTVIAPDTRGQGYSATPGFGYDKRTLAEDIRQLVLGLGFKRIFLVGHDLGATIAYAYAVAYPEDVRALSIIEMQLPGLGLEENAFHITRDSGRWHHVFHAKSELAEMLISGHEREYISWFFRMFAYDPTAISEQDIDEYERCIKAPGALRAGLSYYRAFFDDADFNRRTANQLSMPVLALGGELNQGERVLSMMQKLATNVRGGSMSQCGHWIPEERPDELCERLLELFKDAERRP